MKLRNGVKSRRGSRNRLKTRSRGSLRIKKLVERAENQEKGQPEEPLVGRHPQTAKVSHQEAE